MSKFRLDEVDHQILDMLIDNTRVPFTDIAKKLLISAGTVHVRVKKMEDAGIIMGSSLVLDYDKLGYSFTTHVDFLLVDKTTFAPRLGIELDGNSHNNEFVKKRDYFKDELFRSCGIPLIREAVREEYSHLELQQKILKALSGS